MIQILVCDRVYVTPEMKRKKFLYKIYFILSVLVLISLSSYYIYAEYDRNKSEEVSQEILGGLNIATSIDNEEDEDESVVVEDNVIVVVLNDGSTEEINIDDLIANANDQIARNQENNPVAIPQIYKAKDGTEYTVIATLTIPKLGITYPVLSTCSEELLKKATCKFTGPNPNEVGNLCIAGHNYRNNSFFSKLATLDTKDIIQLQDMSGRVIEYAVYNKYVVGPYDKECLDQATNGKKEITLITCYNNGTQRTIIKATEVK